MVGGKRCALPDHEGDRHGLAKAHDLAKEEKGGEGILLGRGKERRGRAGDAIGSSFSTAARRKGRRETRQRKGQK